MPIGTKSLTHVRHLISTIKMSRAWASYFSKVHFGNVNHLAQAYLKQSTSHMYRSGINSPVAMHPVAVMSHPQK